MLRSNLVLHPYKHLFLVLTVMMAAVLACQVNIGGPEPPGPAIPVSDDLADSLMNEWITVLQDLNESGEVMLIFNESQLTSFLAGSLEAQEKSLITDPQVYLRQGTLQVYGTISQSYLETSVLISIVPVVSEPEGELSFEITSADLGPMPLPEGLRTSISSILTEAFTGSIGPLATGIRIQSIAIADGELALVGTLR